MADSLWDSLSGVLFSNTGLGVASTIGGALIGANANTQAARIAQQGSQAQAQAIEQGNQLAQQNFQQIQQQTAPAVSYLRNVQATAGDLTPLQQQQLGQLRTATGNTLAQSGLRGSGRALVSAERGVESNFVNTADAQNTQRADTAAGTLANGYLSAAANVGNLQARTGQAVGQAAASGAQAAAGATTSNAKMTGAAIGDIASLVASSNKASRYTNNNNANNQSSDTSP